MAEYMGKVLALQQTLVVFLYNRELKDRLGNGRAFCLGYNVKTFR
jgi:hypothetical protein